MDTEPDSPEAGAQRHVAPVARLRRMLLSLPGKLLSLSVIFVLIAEVLIFVPSASNFRTEWLMDRADAAHLAALAAESVPDMEPGEDMVREILASADAVSVARITDGVNELILGGTLRDAKLITADVTKEGFFDRIGATLGTFRAPEGRYVRIIAEPRTRMDTGELISVIVPEAGLRDELYAYSRNIVWLSLFIAAVTGVLLYLVILFILVRPIRRLSRAMTQFQEDPTDRSRTVTASGRSDEIGDAEAALAAMQSEVRAAFAQRERLAALGGAVARINHDLRNVFASAQLISDRLATSKDERVAAMGSRLVRAVDRGIRLCQETLDYGKTQERTPEFQSIAIRNALDDAAGDAFAATGVAEWVNEIDDDVTVSADPDHLHRIFMNLIRNGVQAMDGREGACLTVRAESRDGEVYVTLTDNGPGVPGRVRETLFQPFGISGTKSGSGLGLSIARELARTMGGDVALVTTGDDGTTFEVRLGAG